MKRIKPGKRSKEAIARYVRRRTIYKRNRKADCVAYKGGKCEHCGGVFDPCVFDFHHIDPKTKVTTASSFMNWSLVRVKEEIDKCLMLCANCHRLEHYGLVNNEEGKQMEHIENTLPVPFTDEEIATLLATRTLITVDSEDEDDTVKVGYTDAGTLH